MSDAPKKKSTWQPGMRTINLTDSRRGSKIQSAPTSPQTATKSSPPAAISDSFWAPLDEDAAKIQAADVARKNPKGASSPAAAPPLLPLFDPNAPRGGFGTSDAPNRFEAAMQQTGATGSVAGRTQAGGSSERTAQQENYELRKELARSEKRVEVLEREKVLLMEELESERQYSSYRNSTALFDPALELERQEKDRQIAFVREKYQQDLERIEGRRPLPFVAPRTSPFDVPFTGFSHDYPELDPIMHGGALFARPAFGARDGGRRRYDREAELGRYPFGR